MRAAHERLAAIHPAPGRYRGSFTPGGHEFDVAMQDEAIDFLLAANVGGFDRVVAAEFTGLSTQNRRPHRG